MIQLTDTEVAQFQQMSDAALAGSMKYWQIYQSLADLLQGKYSISATESSVLWLRGATEANAGRGAFSALIRAYTETQYQLRYGTSIPDGKLQKASDEVAKNLLADLLGLNANQGANSWPKGQVPDIARIAFADATAVGDVLFNKPGDTSAPPINSAWSGTLLFSLLRSDQTSHLMSTGDGRSIDTLNDFRDVLYAYKSYEAGVKGALAGFTTTSALATLGTPLQKIQAAQALATDAAILGTTLWGYISNGGTNANLQSALVSGTDNPLLKAAFSVIGDIGASKFLDMLMGAATGKSLIGTTTEASFASRAKTFFTAYGATLQTIDAQLLPANAAGLAATASGANARAALAALSVVSVQVSPVVADQFKLFDPATGQGSITQNWITDRAAFTARHYEQQQRGGGIVSGTQNLHYFDAASKTEVLVGEADFSDVIYGSAGNDKLWSLGGNDALDGWASKCQAIPRRERPPQGGACSYESDSYVCPTRGRKRHKTHENLCAQGAGRPRRAITRPGAMPCAA